MSSNTPLLTATNLTVGYGGTRRPKVLLENLQLTLRPGELVCFMGPNGVGKSTLIRTLAGLQKPLSGSLSSVREKDISVVLTDRVAVANMSVYDLVCYGRYPYLGWNIRLTAQDQAIVEAALASVQVGALADQKIHELSDGQLQMVMIARALAQDTPVLLLDEPTAHLDLNNRVEVMNLLRNLSRTTGKAILMATHELDLALQTADLVWLATHTKNIKTGIPEDLVLDGSFDEVFKFKGFDLKTGKIPHEAHRGIAIKLTGDGPEFLWTKNALERNGFEVVDSGKLEIVILKETRLSWRISERVFGSIQLLLDSLNQL